MARLHAYFHGSIETGLLIILIAATLVGGVTFLGAAATGVFSGLDNEIPVAVHHKAIKAETKPLGPTGLERGDFSRLIAAALAVAAAVLGSAGLIFLLGEKRKRSDLEQEESESPGTVQSRLFTFLRAKRQALLRNFKAGQSDVDKSQLQVRHLMTRSPRTINGKMLRGDVVEMMNRQGVHHLLVVDSDHKLLGVISDRDMNRRGKNAFGLMTPEPVSVSPHHLASPAISMMMDRRISCLPVTNAQGILCGVLTGTDLLVGFQCVLQSLSNEDETRFVATAERKAPDAPLQSAV